MADNLKITFKKLHPIQATSGKHNTAGQLREQPIHQIWLLKINPATKPVANQHFKQAADKPAHANGRTGVNEIWMRHLMIDDRTGSHLLQTKFGQFEMSIGTGLG